MSEILTFDNVEVGTTFLETEQQATNRTKLEQSLLRKSLHVTHKFISDAIQFDESNQLEEAMNAYNLVAICIEECTLSFSFIKSLNNISNCIFSKQSCYHSK